jgi:chromosomal replication initiation ATPase DnaA
MRNQIQRVGKPLKRKPRRLRDHDISYMSLPGCNEYIVFPKEEIREPHIIETLVCNYFGESIAEIRKKGRKRHLVICRQVIMFLMRRYTSLTMVAIARLFRKDHTTVVHAVTTVVNLMDTDPVFRSQIAEIETKLQ